VSRRSGIKDDDNTDRGYHAGIDRGFCQAIPTRILDDVDAVRRRVAERIIELRAQRGWSQEELGARSGLTYKFIGEVERGQKSPSLDSLGRLAQGFGLDIAELFGPASGREPYPRLGADPLVAVREARDSLDRVLDKAAKAAKRGQSRKK
jgi:transcriptional regulator with XRE-family HTH domain